MSAYFHAMLTFAAWIGMVVGWFTAISGMLYLEEDGWVRRTVVRLVVGLGLTVVATPYVFLWLKVHH